MKQQLFSKVCGVFMGLIWVGAAAAQASDEEELALSYGDKSSISIATGNAQLLRRAPSVATVVTAEDIAAMGAKDLDEVMETVPGVHVSRTANSYTSTYIIRGIYGNPSNPQVLMLQNGVPTNSVFRGDKGQAMGALPLQNVARIEIIRGPGSALYGADAYSGVINIITKTAADMPGTELGARSGSFNTRDAWLQHGGQIGEIDVAVFLRTGRSDGNREIVTADAATRLDNIFGTSNSLAPGPVNTGYNATDLGLDFGYEKWRLRTDYKLRDNVGTGVGLAFALDPTGKEKVEHTNVDLSWSDPEFSGAWGLGIIANYLQHNEEAHYVLLPPNTRVPNSIVTDPAVAALLGVPVGTSVSGQFSPDGMVGTPGRWERQMRISSYATYSGFTDHNLRFGLGHEDLNLYKVRTVKNFWLSANGTPVPTGAVIDYSGIQPHQLPHKRFNDYFYAQDEWGFVRDWTLTVGLRRDNYSDFGATTNPRVALVWDATVDLTAKLLYGQAFRAPSQVEQYGINPTSNGYPDLKPETIQTLEAAFSWQARSDTQLNLSFFRFDMKDVIRSVANSTPGTGSTYQNTGKQHGKGMELEAVWDASRSVRLSGNYSYQQSIDEATNTDAGFAPHNHVYARADWRFVSGWLVSPQINWVADRKRSSGDTRPALPNYTTVAMSIHDTWKKDSWDFSFAVLNVFNATVFEPTLNDGKIPNDLPMPGRSVWLQANYLM